jgi:hypothetical protein
MPQGDVEVFHHDHVWRIRVEGESDAIEEHRTKDEAVAAGREKAQRRGVELIVRNQDGKIAERQDPLDIPG